MIDSCYMGDTRDGLRAMIAAGIRAQTCVTSPPYWGLRDYGHAGQIGLEPTPAEYVANMVEVFRLVRDVLADDGTLWLNLGDSYAAGKMGRDDEGPEDIERRAATYGTGAPKALAKGANGVARKAPDGLKPKDLVGIPWRVAFALQADGWFLRSDIIWHKPNPMPESVTDRPTKAHEYLFLLAKQERYFYDAAAIAEPTLGDFNAGKGGKWTGDAAEIGAVYGLDHVTGNQNKGRLNQFGGETRNRRTVWSIATQPYADAHFAVMPRALVEPCVLAGSRTGDVVLDPFLGSGTVAQVAQDLGRRWIGCELNEDYVQMQRTRTAQTALVLEAAD